MQFTRVTPRPVVYFGDVEGLRFPADVRDGWEAWTKRTAGFSRFGRTKFRAAVRYALAWPVYRVRVWWSGD